MECVLECVLDCVSDCDWDGFWDCDWDGFWDGDGDAPGLDWSADVVGEACGVVPVDCGDDEGDDWEEFCGVESVVVGLEPDVDDGISGSGGYDIESVDGNVLDESVLGLDVVVVSGGVDDDVELGVDEVEPSFFPWVLRANCACC